MKKNITPKKTTKRTAKRKGPSAHASAVAVLEFINSGQVPDFLASVVKETIKQACEHLDPHPFFPTYDAKSDGVDESILMSIFKRATPMFGRDLEDSKAALARHIAAVYRHPLTPVRLYNHVGNFITDGTSIKISACEASADSLVDRSDSITLAEEWTWNRRTIERIIDAYNTYEDRNEEVSHATN